METAEKTERASGDDYDCGWGGSWMGIAFIVGGTWWLLGEMGLVSFDWAYAGPIAVIGVGLSMLARRWR